MKGNIHMKICPKYKSAVIQGLVNKDNQNIVYEINNYLEVIQCDKEKCSLWKSKKETVRNSKNTGHLIENGYCGLIQ
jgi:hypothetical protein